jgi:hypothetical protein
MVWTLTLYRELNVWTSIKIMLKVNHSLFDVTLKVEASY